MKLETGVSHFVNGSYATGTTFILAFSIVAGFFREWTRRGAMKPMVQNGVRALLRATAMALTQFVNGAFPSVVIIAFGNIANQFGLSRTLLLLTSGFWAIAFLVTPPYFLVYAKDAERLQTHIQRRRELIIGNS